MSEFPALVLADSLVARARGRLSEKLRARVPLELWTAIYSQNFESKLRLERGKRQRAGVGQKRSCRANPE